MENIVYYYKAKINRVIDGDTIDIMIDLGFGIFKSVRARLWGINAPEISKPKDADELKRGLQTKQFLENWIQNNSIDGHIIIRSHNGKELRQEKYGRWLVEVYPINFTQETQSINDLILKEGLAIEYMRS